MASKIFLIIGIVIILFVLFQVFRTYHFITIGNELAEAAEKVRFSQSPAKPNIRILIIGDSTVVGTGADSPETSLVGLVSKTFPKADVVNKGINGRKTMNLRQDVEELNEFFDLIMLHTGGNDIVRFTDLKQLEKDVAGLLVAAKKSAKKVTLVTSGDVGTALLLPFCTRWIFTKRYLAVREIFSRAAKAHDVTYVDLYREKSVDPFYTDPDTYYSQDYFHPSSAGYSVWYERIEPVIR